MLKSEFLSNNEILQNGMKVRLRTMDRLGFSGASEDLRHRILFNRGDPKGRRRPFLEAARC
jgi:hypothetical protein